MKNAELLFLIKFNNSLFFMLPLFTISNCFSTIRITAAYYYSVFSKSYQGYQKSRIRNFLIIIHLLLHPLLLKGMSGLILSCSFCFLYLKYYSLNFLSYLNIDIFSYFYCLRLYCQWIFYDYNCSICDY